MERPRIQDEYSGRLATGLGLFSIGLGLAELVAPAKLAGLIGVPDDDATRRLLRFYGAREMASGVGILSGSQSANWMWSRVAGDLLDLASLTSAMTAHGADRKRVTIAAAAVAGVTALDVLCASRLEPPAAAADLQGLRVGKSVLINAAVDDVYRFWRDFSNLPRFMSHLESVEPTGDRRSRWRMKMPGGIAIEWDAELTTEETNSRISWRTVENSDIDHTGAVRFDPGPRGKGTFVRVELQYEPPGGRLGAKFAHLAKAMGAGPGAQLEADLKVLKQLMELGEIPKSDASIHRGMHAARPPLSQPA